MRETWEEMRAVSKKWPYPNYIIIPAAGSLIGKSEALRGITTAQANDLVEQILKDHGARKDTK